MKTQTRQQKAQLTRIKNLTAKLKVLQDHKPTLTDLIPPWSAVNYNQEWVTAMNENDAARIAEIQTKIDQLLTTRRAINALSHFS